MRKILEEVVIKGGGLLPTKISYVNREVDLVRTPTDSKNPTGEQTYYINAVLPITEAQYKELSK